VFIKTGRNDRRKAEKFQKILEYFLASRRARIGIKYEKLIWLEMFKPTYQISLVRRHSKIPFLKCVMLAGDLDSPK